MAMKPRYELVEDAQHLCCFDYSIIDTQTLNDFSQKPFVICEVVNKEDAERIVTLLNK
jgi:nitrogen regulatory protein PII-like uncharacterized protein